ncbi:hypothetical protein [Leifsonia sp. 2MCAF36]|uniref:hypothetical protein n=1 Tax=Leifsonia sp. 2MCAF36 TaxID=3232988 RepID=UPI003F97CBFC
MEEEATAEPEWVIPAGAPIRISDWLAPPVAVLLGVVLEVFIAVNAWSRGTPVFAMIGAGLLAVAAVVLGIFGYRAYRDLTPRAVEQYSTVIVIGLLVVGAVLSPSYVGILLLASAGRLATAQRWRPLRLLRTLMPRRLWLRTAGVAAIAGVICILLLPLAQGLDLVPLITLSIAGRIVAPLVFGFAFRLRPGASGIF